MRKLYWKIPAGLAVLGLALALSGCPVNADSRTYHGDGPGGLFGRPTGSVIVEITGLTGTTATVTLLSVNDDGTFGPSIGTGPTPAARPVIYGTVTVRFNNVPFPQANDFMVQLGTGTGATRTHSIPLTVGYNAPISASMFQ